MDLSQQLAVLRPRLLLIVLVTVIAGVLSFALASLIPKTYEAHATLLVGQVYDNSQPSQPPQLNYDAFLASEQLATTFAQLADTRPVLAAVAAQLNLSDDPTSLRDRVDAVTPPGSLFITIAARAPDDASAAALANQVAKELLAEAPGVLAGANVAKAEGMVTLVDPAVAAEATKSPKVTLYAALGALTALIVAVATIFVLAYRESPPFRRAPAARRVGPPEVAPVADLAPGPRPTSTVVETRPVPAVQAHATHAPEPPPGPTLLTEVHRAAPIVAAPVPAPVARPTPAPAAPARTTTVTSAAATSRPATASKPLVAPLAKPAPKPAPAASAKPPATVRPAATPATPARRPARSVTPEPAPARPATRAPRAAGPRPPGD